MTIEQAKALTAFQLEVIKLLESILAELENLNAEVKE